jgi:hypothetical protein
LCPLPLYSKFFNPQPPPHTTALLSGSGELSAIKIRRAAAQRAKLAETICSFSNSLSGGLFLALGLIHLLPEAAESLTALYSDETAEKYRPAKLAVRDGDCDWARGDPDRCWAVPSPCGAGDGLVCDGLTCRDAVGAACAGDACPRCVVAAARRIDAAEVAASPVPSTEASVGDAPLNAAHAARAARVADAEDLRW